MAENFNFEQLLLWRSNKATLFSAGAHPALVRQILSPPRSATKIWPKADTLKFQTDKQDGQTLVFGTIIVPPRKAIRRDKSDF